MKFVTKVKDGCTTVEVIDPTDGAVTHTCEVSEGEQVVVEATTAASPADVAFGGCEAIPEAEAAETGAGDGESGVEQPTGEAEGAEAPTGGEGGSGEGEAGEQSAA